MAIPFSIFLLNKINIADMLGAKDQFILELTVVKPCFHMNWPFTCLLWVINGFLITFIIVPFELSILKFFHSSIFTIERDPSHPRLTSYVVLGKLKFLGSIV